MTTPGIYLSLGSNLGHKRRNLKRALQLLGKFGIKVVESSPVFVTEPVEHIRQPWFFNLVCRVETLLGPHQLLEMCLKIELQMGRIRNLPKGPRGIDIDLLLYRDLVLESADLTIPHPGLHRRRFVLLPLSCIAPQIRDPVTRRTVIQLLEACPDKSSVGIHPDPEIADAFR